MVIYIYIYILYNMPQSPSLIIKAPMLARTEGTAPE